jgi:uncharacterized membrane protein YjjP (DUF1212 family)
MSAPLPLTPADPEPPPPSREPEANVFLLRLVRALHEQGTPSHRLEEAMLALCRRLGAEGQFFSTPTAIFASLEREGRPNVHLIRVGNGGIDMGRLSDLDEVATEVAHARLTPAQGLARVEELDRQPPRYGPKVIVPSFALNSAAASVFFGGGWPEMLTALLIGVCTGLLAMVGGREGKPWRAFEPVAAFCAAVIATVAAVHLGPVSVHVAVLAGLIALLPGYTLVVAIAELANRHLASGSARATSAFMSFATLGFGVALGTKATELVIGVAPKVVLPPVADWKQLAALGVVASTFAFIFRVKRRDFVWVFLVAVLGFCGARLGSLLLGPELGVFLGALGVGISSNLFARGLNRPAAVPLSPGIMLLVPGSIGFRSLSSLMANDVVSGIQTAFTMMLVAVGLVAGLIIANDIVPARRAL